MRTLRPPQPYGAVGRARRQQLRAQRQVVDPVRMPQHVRRQLGRPALAAASHTPSACNSWVLHADPALFDTRTSVSAVHCTQESPSQSCYMQATKSWKGACCLQRTLSCLHAASSWKPLYPKHHRTSTLGTESTCRLDRFAPHTSLSPSTCRWQLTAACNCLLSHRTVWCNVTSYARSADSHSQRSWHRAGLCQARPVQLCPIALFGPLEVIGAAAAPLDRRISRAGEELLPIR